MSDFALKYRLVEAIVAQQHGAMDRKTMPSSRLFRIRNDLWQRPVVQLTKLASREIRNKIP